MSRRLFLGVPVPTDFQKVFKGADLRNIDGIRWIPPKNYHVTVCFLGNIAESSIPLIHASLKDALRSFPSFTLACKNIGLSPQKTMIWAYFESNKAWEHLVSVCRAGLTAFLDKGLSSGKQIPHITLGRSKKPLPSFGNFELSNVIDVRTVILYESRLHDSGSEYVPLYHYEFTHE